MIKAKKRVVLKNANKEEHVISDSGGSPTDMQKSLPANSVGALVGLTKNLGDYESLRADVWSTTVIKKGESREEALDRLTDELVDSLASSVEKFLGGK